MSQKDPYSVLGISKSATADGIKKAYRKLAMQYHPDKNKGDKKSEDKFKEINAAYEVLGDEKKRKQYDTFGAAGDQFGGFSSGQQWFGGFEDIFSQFSSGGGRRGGQRAQNFDFDIGDMFGGGYWTRRTGDHWFEQQGKQKTEEPELDVEKTIEIPVFDLILGMKLDVETVYSKHLTLTIPEGTKSGTKFRIKGKGRQSGGKTGDMYVIVEAKMPKVIPEDVRKLLESIKYRL